MTETSDDVKTQEGDKLWAGKYKTPEEMENALLAQNKEVYKLMDQNKILTTEVKKIGIIPDEYIVPQNLDNVKDEIGELKVIAKQSGLNQDAFAKMVSEINTKKTVEKERFEETKKSIGAENLNVINDYVKKNYPESLHTVIITKIINDPEARKQAMSDRDKRLDSKVPGMGAGNSGAGTGSNGSDDAYEGQSDLIKLGRELEANPHNANIRKKFINLSKDVGHARGFGSTGQS